MGKDMDISGKDSNVLGMEVLFLAPYSLLRGGNPPKRLPMSDSGMKNTDNPRSLPRGWRWVKLGEVCEVITGSTPPRENARFYGGTVPWIKPDDLDRSLYVERSEEYLSEEGARKSRLLPAGSVLVSCIGKLGKSAIAGCLLTSNQQINALVPKEQTNSVFLYYACRLLKPEMEAAASRSLVPILKKSSFASLPIALPPLPEQRRIAAILTEQMAAVERARKAAEEQLAAAKALPAAYLRTVFNSEEAKKWERRRLGEVVETSSGATPDRGNADYYDGDIPWVKTGELRDQVIEDTEEHITPLALQRCSLRLLPSGTLLVAMYGQGQTRGRTAILGKPAAVNQACFAVLPNPEMFGAGYLQLWFRHNYERLRHETEGRGGNQPNLNGVILREQKIPLPPLPVQRRVAAMLTDQMAQAEKVRKGLEEQLGALNKLPAALLRRAFRGEV